MIELESTIENLKLRLEESVSDSEHAYESIKKLEDKLRIKQEFSEYNSEMSCRNELANKSKEISCLQDQNKALQDQTVALKESLHEYRVQVEDLQRSLQHSRNATNKLNKELNENRI